MVCFMIHARSRASVHLYHLFTPMYGMFTPESLRLHLFMFKMFCDTIVLTFPGVFEFICWMSFLFLCPLLSLSTISSYCLYVPYTVTIFLYIWILQRNFIAVYTESSY